MGLTYPGHDDYATRCTSALGHVQRLRLVHDAGDVVAAAPPGYFVCGNMLDDEGGM